MSSWMPRPEADPDRPASGETAGDETGPGPGGSDPGRRLASGGRFAAERGCDPAPGAPSAATDDPAPPAPPRWSPPGTLLPTEEGDGPSLLVTVVAPGGGRTSTRVPATVAVGRLAPSLGALVNVANVAELDDETGTRIPPASTLAQTGLAEGAIIYVVAPGLRSGRGAGAIGVGAETHGPAPLSESLPARTQDPFALPAVSRSGLPVPVALATVVVAAVACLFIGGAVLGSRATRPGPGAIAGQAARAWLGAETFSGAKAAGVPADLGRHGALRATLQPLGEWHHGTDAGATFTVTHGATTVGLTVVTAGGRLAFDPTVSPIPFVSGRTPPEAGGTTRPGGAAPGPLADWAAATFGPRSKLPATLGLGLVAGPQVLASWTPDAGGTVYRVRLDLSSTAPGTPSGREITASRAAAAAVAATTKIVVTDRAAVLRATAAATAAQKVATAAKPPRSAAVSAAVTATRANLTTAAARFHAAQQVLAGQQANAARLGAGPAGPAISVVATYDVWMRAQAVIGWAPAGYDITG